MHALVRVVCVGCVQVRVTQGQLGSSILDLEIVKFELLLSSYAPYKLSLPISGGLESKIFPHNSNDLQSYT